MKLKVVGWTSYDNTELEAGVCGWAAINAIMDEVVKRGYCFSGEDHQESSRCVPVMNDGKMRRMTQRGWGRLMADAHGYNGMYDYSLFSFGMRNCTYPPSDEEYLTAFSAADDLFDEFSDEEDKKLLEELLKAPEEENTKSENGEKIEVPDEDGLIDIDDSLLERILKIENPAAKNHSEEKRILTEEELREKITVCDATAEELAKFLKSGKFIRRDEPIFKYIDTGDILTLRLDGEDFSFIVSEVDREKDFTPEEDKFIWEARYTFDDKTKKRADELFAKTPKRVIISGEFTKTDSWDAPDEPCDENAEKLKKLIEDIRKNNGNSNTEESNENN